MWKRDFATNDEITASFFIVVNLAGTQAEVVRIAGLLRGTESAVEAVSVSPFRLSRDLPFVNFVTLLFKPNTHVDYPSLPKQFGLSSVPIMA